MENYGNSADFQGNETLDDTLLGNELADVAGEVMADLPSMDEPFGPTHGDGTPETAQGKKPEQKEKQKQPELIKTVADLEAWFKKNGFQKYYNYSISFERDWKNNETGLHKGKTTLETKFGKNESFMALVTPAEIITLSIFKPENEIIIRNYNLNTGKDIGTKNPIQKDVQDVLKIFNREIVAYETIQKNEKRRKDQKKAKVVKGM